MIAFARLEKEMAAVKSATAGLSLENRGRGEPTNAGAQAGLGFDTCSARSGDTLEDTVSMLSALGSDS